MKTYRPYCPGYIALYVLICISLADTAYTVYGQVTGTLNPYMSSFSMFSYLVAAMAICYGSLYIRAKVCMDEQNLRIAFPATIQPPEGSKRAMIIFRSGSTDLKLIDKTFAFNKIERYGYVEDLGFSRVDKSNGGEKTFFPVHEVCFLTSDGKRYHMNAAIYSKKQRKAIFDDIRERSGVAPEGALAGEL